MGTASGLLRCRLPNGRWERPLRDIAIHGGTAAGDALLLAVTRREGAGAAKRLQLLRFTPADGRARDYPVAGAGVATRNGAGSVTVLPENAGAVWLIGWPDPDFGAAVRDIYRIDAATGNYTLYQDRSRNRLVPDSTDQQRIPDPVVRALLASGIRTAGGLTERHLTGWACPPAELPGAVSGAAWSLGSVSARSRLPDSRWTDPAGRVWSGTQGALVSGAGETIETFPLPDRPLSTMPPIGSLAVVGDTLFARSGDAVYRYDAAARSWSSLVLPPLTGDESAHEDRMQESDGALWIQRGDSVFRYDVQTRALVCAGSRIEPTRVGAKYLTLLPGGGIHDRTGNAPFARAGGLEWTYRQDRDENGSERTVVTPDADGMRRRDLHFPGHAGRVSLRAFDGGVYVLASVWSVPAPQGDAPGVWRYDAAQDRWSAVTPIPAAAPLVSFDLISVDAERIWAAERGTETLWEYDRRAGRWRKHPFPSDRRWGWTDVAAARLGDSIYVGISTGLWRLDPARDAWERSPLPGSARELRLGAVSGAGDAVWALGKSTRSGQTFAVRFDRKTHDWTIWGEERGFPERLASEALTLDAAAAPWVVAGGRSGGTVLQWDAAADRWVRRTDALAPESGMEVRAAGLGFDGESVWINPYLALVPETLRQRTPRSSVPALARWDAARGAWETFAVPPDAARTMHVEKGAVWLAGENGVVRLDTRTRRWQTEPLPPSVARFALPTWSRLVHTPEGLWLLGSNTILQWQDAGGAEGGS